MRHLCTTNKNGRFIERSYYQQAIEDNEKRVSQNPDYYRLRQQITENERMMPSLLRAEGLGDLQMREP